MRKVIFQVMISLDGFFEGEAHDISWHNVDDEFNAYAIDLLHKADALLFGRVTYELMASYWPAAAALTNDPVVAGLMNTLPKYVFSKTLPAAAWLHTTLVKEDAVEELAALKAQSGKDLVILGSSSLAKNWLVHGLIDECRIIVNPVVLGSGKTLFEGITAHLALKLADTRRFESGNVMLTYIPALV